MRRTERTDRDSMLGLGDIDVRGGMEEFVQQRSPLVVAAGVVRSE